MANYGPDDIVIKMDVADGGSLTDISQYVQGINGVSIERLTELVHTFGDSWEEHAPVGVRRMDDLELDMLYDDHANVSANLITGAHTQTRTVEITWGSTKVTTFEAWITKTTRTPARNALTRLTATLRPTGTITEA